jgi:hypothetical protein
MDRSPDSDVRACGSRHFALLAALLCAATGCRSESPLEFADWTLPVPEDARVFGYRAVPVEERTESIELVAEAVMGRETGAEGATFFRPVGLAADDVGRVFVLDAGEDVVKAFGPAGAFVKAFGRSGQGPGEMQFPRSITIVGSNVIVSDQTRARLITWSTDGEYVDEVAVEFTRGFSSLFCLADGSFVVAYDSVGDDWPLNTSFGKVTAGGELATDFFQLAAQTPMYRHEHGFQSLDLPDTRPRLAATRSGLIYVTRGDEYQVLALDAAGETRWALRVAAPRVPYDETDVDEAIRLLADMFPEMRRDNIDLPDGLPALADIAVDGHGHLYVLPYTRDHAANGSRPVDVYSEDGELLFSGLLHRDLAAFAGIVGAGLWRAAKGDLAYAFASDSLSSETVAVRYRLVEPF